MGSGLLLLLLNPQSLCQPDSSALDARLQEDWQFTVSLRYPLLTQEQHPDEAPVLLWIGSCWQ